MSLDQCMKSWTLTESLIEEASTVFRTTETRYAAIFRVWGRGEAGIAVIHLIVKGKLLPSTDVTCSEECNPGESWVHGLDPYWIYHKVWVTL